MESSHPFKVGDQSTEYKISKNETFGIVSQIKRSSSSIGDCLAEGSGRITPRDKAHFTNMSYASALETLNHLIISKELGYITEQEYLDTRAIIENLTLIINGLRRSQLNP